MHTEQPHEHFRIGELVAAKVWIVGKVIAQVNTDAGVVVHIRNQDGTGMRICDFGDCVSLEPKEEAPDAH